MSQSPWRVDISLRVRFLTTAEGGRRGHVGGPGVEFYSCPIDVADPTMYDCRIWLGGRVLELGREYEVDAALLSPENLSRFFVGQRVSLWEGRTVAYATIDALHPK